MITYLSVIVFRMSMKKIISLVIAFISFAVIAQAQEPTRGYRGFLDWENNVGSIEENWAGNINSWWTGVTTTHGFQFNPHFYFGAGLGAGTYKDHNKHYTGEGGWLQLFIDARTDQKFGKYTPYADIKLGVMSHGWSDDGWYLNPSVGYRFHIIKKLNVNVGVGATLYRSKGLFNFRVGIDF